MVKIVTEVTNNARGIQAEFAKYDRDYFPLEVYQGIYDYIQECYNDEYYKLDVIAWCCDIEETDDADDVDGYILAEVDNITYYV